MQAEDGGYHDAIVVSKCSIRSHGDILTIHQGQRRPSKPASASGAVGET